MIWKRFVDILLMVFFLLSLFYLFKNLFSPKTGYWKISEYRESIEGLKKLLEVERRRHSLLLEKYRFVRENPDVALQNFVGSRLWLVPPDYCVSLFPEKNSTSP